MKGYLVGLFVCLSLLGFSQTPKLINYQGVARGSDGLPILDQTISLRFRILQGSQTGTVAYTESQTVKTNSLGLILTQIGLNANLGVLSWKNGPYFLEVGADMTGGNAIAVLGVQQLMGVPFSFHASTVPAAYNATTNVLDVGGNTFTLSSTPITTVSGLGIATVLNPNPNSFVVGVPQPNFTSTGSSSITGTYPNYTLSSSNPTISSSGIINVTSPSSNSFVVGAVQPSFTTNGPSSISGTYPNYTLNSTSPTITATGNVNITNVSTNNYQINVPFLQVSTTNSIGAAGISGSGTNSLNINIPAGVSPTVNGAGAVSISPATVGNNFTITVPPTGIALTQTGTTAGINATGTNSFNLNIPPAQPATITPFGVLTRTATGNSFSLSVPGTSITNSGAAVVTSIGTNTFNVFVPNTSISGGGVVNIANPTVNTFVVSVPQTTVTGTGAAQLSTTGTNTFNINVPTASVIVTSTPGAVGYTSLGTNSVSINVPPAIAPTLVATGLATSTASGNTFTVDVPVLVYNGTTGALSSGTNAVNISQVLALNGTTLTSGASSNSVNLVSVSPWRQATGAVTLATSSDKVGIGGSAPSENLQVESASSTSLSLLSIASGTSDIDFGTPASHTLARIRFDNSVGAMSFWTSNNSRAYFNSSGQMVIGTANPFATSTGLTVGRAGAFNNQLMISGGDASNSFGGILTLGENQNPTVGMSVKLDAGTNRLVFTNDLTGSTPVVSIGGYAGANNGMVVGTGYAGSANPPIDGALIQGNLGIATTNPGTRLEVNGDISIPNGNKIVFGTISSGSGTGEWIQNSANGLQFSTASITRMNITTAGNMGLGIANPTTMLHVAGGAYINNNTTIGNSVSPSTLQVAGAIRLGSETGTSQGPTYPYLGSPAVGLVIRRVYTTNVTAGSTVALTPDLSFERDGSNGGFRITRVSSNSVLTCHCTGVTSSGGAITRTFSGLGAGSTVVFANSDNVEYFHCMFGDPAFGSTGHITEISLSRYAGDYYWIGTMTTTQNQ